MPAPLPFGYGIERIRPGRVAILVGPNGSGKSNFLKRFAEAAPRRNEIAVVTNTAHDRFSGLRGFQRVSAARGARLPDAIIKAAAVRVLDAPDSRLSDVSSILEYCGYAPRLGFLIKCPPRHRRDNRFDERYEGELHFEIGRAFIQSQDEGQGIWIDQRISPLAFSKNRDFASVLHAETWLRRAGYLDRIVVFLERNDGVVIELSDASSGELSLISSLIFIAALGRDTRFLLIDEPENSLHPRWQREYVDLVLSALRYNEVGIAIATHAPILVTGALAKAPERVDVFQVNRSETLYPLHFAFQTARAAPHNIEEVLWEVFDMVTPANHFVSERIVALMDKLEAREISVEVAHARVEEMRDASFDERQLAFFEAVHRLIDKVADDFGEAMPRD